MHWISRAGISKTSKVVVNGAGAAAIACIELIKAMGLPHESAILCDTSGVIYQGREDRMNQWKSAHAAPTKARTLAEAIEGADVFLGLSVKDAVTKDMAASMADRPILFAMANPDPEIHPDDIKEVAADAIIATGRSDFPNQVNNVLGFPYIFRGALDVRATTINEEMKIAAANAIAELARRDVPDEVAAAYGLSKLQYGPDYIMPTPFDQRLIEFVPPAVAKAAMDTGVARKPIAVMESYRRELAQRLDPTAASLQAIYASVRDNKRRVVFAEGEDEKAIRAALNFRNAGLGTPILVAREDVVKAKMAEMGLSGIDGVEINNARISDKREDYAEFLYQRLQRKGSLYRDCQRWANQNRNIFSACMVAKGEADAMVTGLTRGFSTCFEDIRKVFDPQPGHRMFGLTLFVERDRTLFLADTSLHEVPTPEMLADIAVQSAAKARQLGHEPRVAFLSFSNFGNLMRGRAERIRDAVKVMQQRRDVNFEFDGEMTADMALQPELRERIYPFSKLTGAANVLIMPGLHAAHIASRLLQQTGNGSNFGPILIGLSNPVQIVQMRATVSDVMNAAALVAHESIRVEHEVEKAKARARPLPAYVQGGH